MATYSLVPIDTDRINERFPELADKYVKYQPLNFNDINWADAATPASGYVTLLDSSVIYLVHPTDYGFMVTKQYVKNPDESDKVLQDWGDYLEYDMFSRSDIRLQRFIEHSILNSELSLCDEMKMSYRLRAFQPRRSNLYFGKITLYQCQKDRDKNREVAMKPARALQLMFPELEHKSVINITDDFLREFAPRDFTLHTSKEADAFKLAYSGEQSPNENINTTQFRKSLSASCMRYDFDHLSCHPAEAYASGDFEIVYTTDQRGLVASRCVVYTNHDTHPQAGPIYGVSEQAIDIISDHLDSIIPDYRHNKYDATWVGARLKRIPVVDRYGQPDGFIAPYLDLHPQRLDDNGNHLVVCHHGDIDASQYQGVLSQHHTCCSQCSTGLTEDEYYYSEYTEEHYCESCYYEEHFYCDYYGETVHNEDAWIAYRINHRGVVEQVRVARQAVEYGDHFVYCSDGEYWEDGDTVYCSQEDVYISPNDVGNYFQSDWDSEYYHVDALCVTTDGDNVAKSELEEHSGIWQLNDDGYWDMVQEELDV